MITIPSVRCQTEASVLGNDVTFGVLGDDLISIPRRRGKDVEHDLLDRVGQLAELLRRTTFLEVNTYKRHASS